MNLKKWIMLCAAVVLILAVLMVWKPFRDRGPETAQAPSEDEQQTDVLQSEETQEVKTEEIVAEEPAESAQQTSGAAILEDGGDLEIIIPEDEDSAGF